MSKQIARKEALEAFIKRWLEDGSLQELVCCFVTTEGPDVLDTCPAKQGKKRALAADVIERFGAAVLSHAEASSAIGQYRVAAMGTEGMRAQHLLIVRSDLDQLAERAGAQLEPAAMRGRELSEQMFRDSLKFVRDLYKIQTQSAVSTMARMSSELDRKDKRIAFVEEKQLELITLVQELLDRSAQRKLEEKAEEAKLERTDRAWEKLEDLAPVVMSKITGAHPVGKLLSSLTEDQLGALFGALDDEQREQLHEVIKLAHAGEQAAEKFLLAGGPPAAPKAERKEADNADA